MKVFPVHPSNHKWRKAVPWSLVEDHESQAKRNHSQSLGRLAERGGLDPVELWAVIRDVSWSDPMVRAMSVEEAKKIIDEWIQADTSGKQHTL